MNLEKYMFVPEFWEDNAIQKMKRKGCVEFGWKVYMQLGGGPWQIGVICGSKIGFSVHQYIFLHINFIILSLMESS